LRLDPSNERFAYRVYEPAASSRDGTVAAFRRRRRRRGRRRFGQLGAQAAARASRSGIGSATAAFVVPKEVFGLVFQLLAQRMQQRRSGFQLETRDKLVKKKYL